MSPWRYLSQDILKPGIRLDQSTVQELLVHADLIELGANAAQMCEQRHGHQVHITDFEYVRIPHRPLSLASEGQVVKLIEQIQNQPHFSYYLVGIYPSESAYQNLLHMIRLIRKGVPNARIVGMTACEAQQMSEALQRPLPDIFSDLIAAGITALDPRGVTLHDTSTATTKRHTIHWRQWLTIHQQAHRLGLGSEAVLPYGFGETIEQLTEFMEAVRDEQDQYHQFEALHLLPNHAPDPQQPYTPRTNSIFDLKLTALSRLFFDNIEHIKVSWGRFGSDLSQLALAFGANALAGHYSKTNNSSFSGDTPFRPMNTKELESLVRACQKTTTRVTYNGIKAERRPVNLEQLLYKLEQTNHLAASDWTFLAEHADAISLARCIMKTPHMDRAVGLFYPRGLFPIANEAQELTQECAFDFSWQFKDLPIAMVKEKIRQTLQLEQRQGIALGIKGIWNLAREAQVPLAEFACQLAEIGIRTMSSSVFESEEDLTTNEIIRFHETCHQQDMRTVAKVEIATTYNGTGEPFWQPFIERLLQLKQLQQRTNGCLGVSIEKARGTWLSPYTYCKALALARLILDNVEHIICPFTKIPTLQMAPKRMSATGILSKLKTAPVTVFFGATHFGGVPPEPHISAAIMQVIRESHLHLSTRH